MKLNYHETVTWLMGFHKRKKKGKPRIRATLQLLTMVKQGFENR